MPKRRREQMGTTGFFEDIKWVVVGDVLTLEPLNGKEGWYCGGYSLDRGVKGSIRYVKTKGLLHFAGTTLKELFADFSNLRTADLSAFETSQATSMYGMFNGCRFLTDIDLSGFDTRKITDMRFMFKSCSSLKTLDLSNFITSEVNNMDYMFYGCYSLATLDISSFNTSKVGNMYSMFEGCRILSGLNLSSFNTSLVEDMTKMFHDCNCLEKLDLSNFDTSNVTEMKEMFSNCIELKELNISNFQIDEKANYVNLFDNCYKLAELDLTNFEHLKNDFYNRSGLSLTPRHYIVSEKIEKAAKKIAPIAPFLLAKLFGFYDLKTIAKILNALEIMNRFNFSKLKRLLKGGKCFENCFALYKAVELSQSGDYSETQTICRIFEIFKAHKVSGEKLETMTVSEIVNGLKSHGIDSDINAYLNGVPLEDILA